MSNKANVLVLGQESLGEAEPRHPGGGCIVFNDRVLPALFRLDWKDPTLEGEVDRLFAAIASALQRIGCE
jgi:hypothetical protein